MRLISFKCIGIGRIFQEENKIMRNLEHHKSVFYYIPLGIGFFCTIFFYHDNSTIVNILTLFLSIFIPIFISLLATLISFVMNKIKTRHNKIVFSVVTIFFSIMFFHRIRNENTTNRIF